MKKSSEESAKEFFDELHKKLKNADNKIPTKIPRTKGIRKKDKDYADLLKSPHWQRKRLRILERDEWKCRMCDDTENPLHVHHKYYLKDAKPWEYPDDSLITFCDECHDNYHKNKSEFIKDIDEEIEKIEKYLIRKNKELRNKYIKPLEDLK